MSDRTDQMFFDRGSDSFLGELISICKPRKILIEIRDPAYLLPEFRDQTVRVQFKAEFPGRTDYLFSAAEYGRSYGECLYKIRQKIREEVGQ